MGLSRMKPARSMTGGRGLVLNKTAFAQCFHAPGNFLYIAFLKMIFMTGRNRNA